MKIERRIVSSDREGKKGDDRGIDRSKKDNRREVGGDVKTYRRFPLCLPSIDETETVRERTKIGENHRPSVRGHVKASTGMDGEKGRRGEARS